MENMESSILFTNIIAVYCEKNLTKTTNTEFLMFKRWYVAKIKTAL